MNDNKNIIKNKLSKKINSLSFDKEDLNKLLSKLQIRANTACEIECVNIESLISTDILESNKEKLRSCSTLKITINGFQSEELFGGIEEVFSSLSFPEKVKSIYVNSEFAYRAHFTYYPENSFELFIDFSKPKAFDLSFSPSAKTPNDSNFTVQGADDTWVNGVFFEIDSYIKERQSKLSQIHRGSSYDLIVWFIGIPMAFWACYKVINLNIYFLTVHSFLQSIFLTYCFLLSLFIFRILFHYFRWIFPMIEYRNKKERSIIHQIILGSIIISIIANFLTDIIKKILSL